VQVIVGPADLEKPNGKVRTPARLFSKLYSLKTPGKAFGILPGQKQAIGLLVQSCRILAQNRKHTA
jgi:hypothetical protein